MSEFQDSLQSYRETLSRKTKQPTNETQTRNHKRLVDISTTLKDTHVCTHTHTLYTVEAKAKCEAGKKKYKAYDKGGEGS